MVVASSLYRMPPEGYQTVTVSDETAQRLAEVMMRHDAETMAEAVATASRLALGHEPSPLPGDDLNRSLQEMREAHEQIASAIGQLQESL